MAAPPPLPFGLPQAFPSHCSVHRCLVYVPRTDPAWAYCPVPYAQVHPTLIQLVSSIKGVSASTQTIKGHRFPTPCPASPSDQAQNPGTARLAWPAHDSAPPPVVSAQHLTMPRMDVPWPRMALTPPAPTGVVPSASRRTIQPSAIT